ncbi:response regulator transcription factor [Anaeromicrobium sediminis]|uniref:Stage 0 sporulation protein A homolog n=1 Tax=Anaeromicrobium sediminis TaxID=1478221 RepID=A0A267MMM0_9FIRM|nr:response regulator transcription factor [Anaeromicrobium sediminis]PAB60115.1 DNA-binding response regulator [Anaeromicrobium sediminis]
MKKRILVVDDESKFRDIIRIFLENEGYSVDEATSGTDALNKLYEHNYSLVLLDVTMPEMDGWHVCRRIKDDSSIPVIMITARETEYEKLFGFQLGIDDYITKPFSPSEMVARVKVVLRRICNTPNHEKNTLKIGGLKINNLSKKVYLEDNELVITPKEFNLLMFFAQNPNIAYSRDQILNKVWGYDFIGDLRTVDTHIKQLRSKLGKSKNYISTIWGYGYKFNAES